MLGYGPIGADLDNARLDLIWGDARVFADHPDKPFDSQPGSALAQTSVTYNLFEVIRTAQKEVVIVVTVFRAWRAAAWRCCASCARATCG